MSAQEHEYWKGIADELDKLGHGDKEKRIQEVTQAKNISKQTLYRRLEKFAGWTSGSQRRSDKGDCELSDEELRLIANYMRQTTRQNGKRLMTVKRAMEILYADGQISTKLHPSTVSERLAQRGIHPDQLNMLTPHVGMRSESPNHVWQVDASVCVLVYMSNGGVVGMDAKEFYKNKPQNLEKIKNRRVIRYVMYDHYSAAIKVLYFEGSGETPELLIQFLIWAFSKQDSRLMYGVPDILMWDKGSANTSHMAKTFLEQLSVRHIAHATGNSRSKGGVENAQNLIEREFESRLASMTVASIGELNEKALQWQIAYNNRETVKRHGHARMQMWQKNAGVLRLCPSPEVCAMLCESKPQTRKVTKELTVQFTLPGYPSQQYRVRHVPEVRIGMEVTVTVNPYRVPNIVVTTVNHLGESKSYECEPVKTNEAGFALDAPVIGEEPRTAPQTVTDVARNEMLKQAHNVGTVAEAEKRAAKHAPVFTDINAMADVEAVEGNLPALMQRKGEMIEVTPKVMVGPPLGFVPTLKRVREALGQDLTAQQRERVRELYPEGATEEDIPAIVKLLSQSNVVELSKIASK